MEIVRSYRKEPAEGARLVLGLSIVVLVYLVAFGDLF